MKLYAVFLPHDGSPAETLERAAFVKQGFHWEAFLLTPVWALRRGLWTAFGLWIAWVAVTMAIAFAFGLGSGLAVLLYWIGAAAFGLESDLFEQGRLTKSGFAMQALAMGGSRREAELVFFCGKPDNIATPPSNESDRQTPMTRPPAGSMDLLGLFPPEDFKT